MTNGHLEKCIHCGFVGNRRAVWEHRCRPTTAVQGTITITFDRGDRVTYVPSHVPDGDIFHEEAEDGTVSSVREDVVLVKFDFMVKRDGWEGARPVECDPSELVNHGGPRDRESGAHSAGPLSGSPLRLMLRSDPLRWGSLRPT